jgi:hypothetical protein
MNYIGIDQAAREEKGFLYMYQALPLNIILQSSSHSMTSSHNHHTNISSYHQRQTILLSKTLCTTPKQISTATIRLSLILTTLLASALSLTQGYRLIGYTDSECAGTSYDQSGDDVASGGSTPCLSFPVSIKSFLFTDMDDFLDVNSGIVKRVRGKGEIAIS